MRHEKPTEALRPYEDELIGEYVVNRTLPYIATAGVATEGLLVGGAMAAGASSGLRRGLRGSPPVVVERQLRIRYPETSVSRAVYDLAGSYGGILIAGLCNRLVTVAGFCPGRSIYVVVTGEHSRESFTNIRVATRRGLLQRRSRFERIVNQVADEAVRLLQID